jgi:anion-transporting  ArsA/GET3 family ATPase
VSEPLEALLSRRLLIVTGKGGTGKTTLTAALAIAAARRGIDTVAVEVASDPALPSLLSARPRRVAIGDGRTPVRVGPHLFTLRIDPEVALCEYLELQLRARALVALVVRNPGFRRLLAAAPGWRELITLGKLWHLATREERGRPRYRLLVVDAPSTGHGLSFLSIPGVVLQSVRLGPLRRHTDLVQQLLSDPARTLVVPVTLLEELPVRETLELCSGVHELGLALGPVVANSVEPVPAVPDLAVALAALQAMSDELAPGQVLAPSAIRSCLVSASRRAALQREFLDVLAAGVDAPVVEICHRAEGVPDFAGAEHVARELEARMTSVSLPELRA